MIIEPVRVEQEKPKRLTQRGHRIAIGLLGLSLPLLVYLFAGWRLTDGLTPWHPLQSVSAYYYTGGVAIFIGVLFAMALFLITYPGYEGFVWDRVVGVVGGSAGLGVALFPTGVPDGVPALSWWRKSTGVIHYSCALVMFASFVVFSVWLFRRSNIPDKNARPPEKRRRDAVCLVCGISIVAFLIWAALSARAGQSILLPESLAIIAFAVSWLAKGEFHHVVGDAMRSVGLSPSSERASTSAGETT
jgi:hypothetical protein